MIYPAIGFVIGKSIDTSSLLLVLLLVKSLIDVVPVMCYCYWSIP